jgi:hypothetical protein
VYCRAVAGFVAKGDWLVGEEHRTVLLKGLGLGLVGEEHRTVLLNDSKSIRLPPLAQLSMAKCGLVALTVSQYLQCCVTSSVQRQSSWSVSALGCSYSIPVPSVHSAWCDRVQGEGWLLLLYHSTFSVCTEFMVATGKIIDTREAC